MRLADTELRELERIVDLCRYDYVRIIRHFISPEQRGVKGGKVKYHPADASLVANDIADLFSVVSGTRMTPQAQKDILLLAKRTGKENATALEKKLPKICQQIDNLLDTVFSDQILCAMLQLVKGDSRYFPPSPIMPPSRLNNYRDTFARRFKDDIDRIQREIRQSALSAEIQSLFGTASGSGLLPVSAYNEELNVRLQTEASISLKNILPFQLLKTFERRYLTREFIDACKRIVIEGFFNNTLFRSRMTEAIARIEKTQARITVSRKPLPHREGQVVSPFAALSMNCSRGKSRQMPLRG
jgi:hypothetical protein